MAALRELNQSYLDSVVRSDVARFREILADDFLCTNAEGRLLDKAGFLEHTAAAHSLASLAGEDVRIRVLDDVAIVHAKTVYTLTNGQHGQGRYTDIWAKREGHWLAIAAHVSRGVQ